jgi:N-sulfoglucosamine sulfohydrolase
MIIYRNRMYENLITKNTMKHISLYLPIITGLVAVMPGCAEKKPGELPNILWITSEDNSPFAGCYGDEFATTPNMDRLASQGFLYTHAYANAPVCAPARNTILTGIYASSGGNQNMRSQYPKSDIVKPYPVYLREAGYYCTNNVKEDYNLPGNQTRGIWDESSRNAHYMNRKPGQPFFAVFNSTISHESSIHKRTPLEKLRHDPQKVKLPPYHPDTPDMRHDWAQYYDRIEDMDAWIGTVLQELEESGEAENTIVFYYGDHGGVLGRSKRFVYESGTRVPFIVRIPEKYKYLYPAKKPGSKVDRIVSFVDLFPTLLSITGITVPGYLQGNAFLGDQKTPDPEYAYMFRDRMDERVDMCRAVRDRKFRYIRNYMPHRPHGQYLQTLWNAPSMQSWEEAYKNGQCNEAQSRFWLPKAPEELYDTENDPWEVNNLSGDPAYSEVLQRMRNECNQWCLRIRDTGFLPEADRSSRAAGQPFYDYFRSPEVPLEKIIESANRASSATASDLETLSGYVKNIDSGVRYWGVTGLLILGEDARPAIPVLVEALDDTSPNVACAAAEALYGLGEKEAAVKALVKVLEVPDEMANVFAMNVLEITGANTPELQKAVINVVASQPGAGREKYDMRLAKALINRWGIDPQQHNITFSW